MYYYATQDRVWLENIGWPLLRDIARFWTSRVTKTNNMTYSINKVMPVDEWCDNEQSKCGSIGVNNAIQTNAVAIMSLVFATKVGNMFGFDVDPEWEIIAKKLKINFDHKTQTHIQWDNGNGFLLKNEFNTFFYVVFSFKTSTLSLCLSRR